MKEIKYKTIYLNIDEFNICYYIYQFYELCGSLFNDFRVFDLILLSITFLLLTFLLPSLIRSVIY